MLRQCAWCLRLINSEGDRLSPLPKPKLYEASHGICEVCAMQCMEQLAVIDFSAGYEQDSAGYYPENIALEKQASTSAPLRPQKLFKRLVGARKTSKMHMRLH